ncbi:hypothetical protein DXG03_006918 [Asterophora parasitica]|uniref:Uncharacterized protein n=1 Tax=Asterophora parasitica TaxID=117018 RepID=A0A9P7KDB5_9AGAR|nr:hypothetical protein DXG03_006918 [Asterophora parasitica]
MSREALTSVLRKNKKRKGKVDLGGVPLAVRRKGKRVFHCPVSLPGFLHKTYLNPNGLKYHQEKGTCKIEHTVLPAPAAMSGPQDIPVPVTDAVETAPPAHVPLASDAELPPVITVPPVPQHQQHIYHPQPRQCLIGSADALTHRIWSGIDDPKAQSTNASADLLIA